MVNKMKQLSFYGTTATLLLAMSSITLAAGIPHDALHPKDVDHITESTPHNGPNYYDFGADAIGNEKGAKSISNPYIDDRKGSVGVTARGYKIGDDYTKYNSSYYAYLDDYSNKKEGGLGVCKELGTVNGVANQCKPGNDDNVTKGEVLRLSFDKKIDLGDIEFHDGNHGWDFTGNVDISIDGGSFTSYALEHVLKLHTRGSEFLFRNSNAGESAGEQFYVTAINTTPIPAAVWLFMSGLGSLGYFRKKKPNLKLVA